MQSCSFKAVVHRAGVTMVTRLVFPSKPQQTLAEFQSRGQKKRGGLAAVLLELRVTKEGGGECGEQQGGMRWNHITREENEIDTVVSNPRSR